MEVSIGQRAARLYADGPGNPSPLKGAHLSPNRWSTACGRGYILSPLRGSLGCVKYVDASLWERGYVPKSRLYVQRPLNHRLVMNSAILFNPLSSCSIDVA